MKIQIMTDKTIGWLIHHWEKKVLRVDHEYQRAPVWNKNQKQMFIDSVLREYSIPAFYLHIEQIGTEDYPMKGLNIIDGQQRIRALYEYHEGAYTLLDPAEESNFSFPNFMREEDCPWAKKRYKELNSDIKEKFMNHKVVIYQIETDNKNKIRDLFIRLQGGTPLTPQEKRDSWPGNFTDYILELGGKQGIDRYPGNTFFTEIGKPSGGESNKRRLAAQIAMLYTNARDNRRVSGGQTFCDIKSTNIDHFYHKNIGFDSSSKAAKRFEEILDTLATLFKNSKIIKGKGHYSIGVVLLVDRLLEDYTDGWKENFLDAFTKFHQKCLEAAKASKDDNLIGEKREYYDSYVRWTSTSTDAARTIRGRHQFFVSKMLLFMNPTPKDPRNNFTNTEREIVFYRDKGNCQVCRMNGSEKEVQWDDAEIHHVHEHHRGGKSVIDNGALVHKRCHPKGEQAVAVFRYWWENKRHEIHEENTRPRKFPPPEGTKCRFTHKGVTYYGKIEQRKLHVENHDTYGSFSKASMAVIANSSRNGWLDWELKLPGHDDWIPADNWRKWIDF